jgi:NodT family efflux transporter outer membrane factor (OMF) lipoprotein
MGRRTITFAAIVVAAGAALPSYAQAQTQRSAASTDMTFWRSLGDTTLTRLITSALGANRDLRGAEARIQAARAARTDAALDLAPAVTASAGYSRQRMSSAMVPGAIGRPPEQGLWDAGLQLAWEVDVFGRGRRSLQARSALVESAEEDALDAGVVVAAEVARAYLELRGIQERLAVGRQNAENQRRTLELTLARLEAGSGTALDTERAQAQLSSTLAGIPMLESAIEAEQHRLAVLIGSPPTAEAVQLANATPPLTLPAELELERPDVVVRQRADVRGSASRSEAGSALVGAAKAGYLPRISIAAAAGYTSSEFDALGNTGTPRYVVGPVISWPLFDLGRVKTDVDEARAREAELNAQHEQLVLSALAEVETSRAGYRSARTRLRHLEEAAAASERATELARLRFEEGGTGFLEVLDTERRQLEAQDRLAQGRTQAAHWLVNVYRAHAH